MGNKKKCSKKRQKNTVDKSGLSSGNKASQSKSLRHLSQSEKPSDKKKNKNPENSKNKKIQCQRTPETSCPLGNSKPPSILIPLDNYSPLGDTTAPLFLPSSNETSQNILPLPKSFRYLSPARKTSSSPCLPFCNSKNVYRNYSPQRSFPSSSSQDVRVDNCKHSTARSSLTLNPQQSNLFYDATVYSSDKQPFPKSYSQECMTVNYQTLPRETPKAPNYKRERHRSTIPFQPSTEAAGDKENSSYTVIDIEGSWEKIPHCVNTNSNNQYFDPIGDQNFQTHVFDPNMTTLNQNHHVYSTVAHQYDLTKYYPPQNYFVNRNNTSYFPPPITVDRSVQTDDIVYNYQEFKPEISKPLTHTPVDSFTKPTELTESKKTVICETDVKTFSDKSTSTTSLVSISIPTKDIEIQTLDRNLIPNCTLETKSSGRMRNCQSSNQKDSSEKPGRHHLLCNDGIENSSSPNDSSQHNCSNNYNELRHLFESLSTKNMPNSKCCNENRLCKCGHSFANHSSKSGNAEKTNAQSPRRFCKGGDKHLHCLHKENDGNLIDGKVCPTFKEKGCFAIPCHSCYEYTKDTYGKSKCQQSKSFNECIHDDDEEFWHERNLRNKPHGTAFKSLPDICNPNINYPNGPKRRYALQNKGWWNSDDPYEKPDNHDNISQGLMNCHCRWKPRENLYENAYSREPPAHCNETTERKRPFTCRRDAYHDQFTDYPEPYSKRYVDFSNQDFLNSKGKIPTFNRPYRQIDYGYGYPVDYSANDIDRPFSNDTSINVNCFHNQRNYLNKQQYYRSQKQRDDENRNKREMPLRNNYIGEETYCQPLPEVYAEYETSPAYLQGYCRPAYRDGRSGDHQVRQESHYHKNPQPSSYKSPRRTMDSMYSSIDIPPSGISNKYIHNQYCPLPSDNCDFGYRPKISPFTSTHQQSGGDCQTSGPFGTHYGDRPEYEQSSRHYEDLNQVHMSECPVLSGYQDRIPPPADENGYLPYCNTSADRSFPLPPPPPLPNSGRNTSRPNLEKVLMHKPPRTKEFTSVMTELKQCLTSKGKWNGEDESKEDHN